MFAALLEKLFLPAQFLRRYTYYPSLRFRLRHGFPWFRSSSNHCGIEWGKFPWVIIICNYESNRSSEPDYNQFSRIGCNYPRFSHSLTAAFINFLASPSGTLSTPWKDSLPIQTSTPWGVSCSFTPTAAMGVFATCSCNISSIC